MFSMPKSPFNVILKTSFVILSVCSNFEFSNYC
jgi:hypothetical protein